MAKSLSNIIRAGSSATPLPVSFGGTGLATITANSLLLGNGTSVPNLVAPGASGNVLMSNGTTWASSSLPSSIPSIPRTTKSSAYTLVAGDKGTLIEVTSGTFTLSLTAAATLGNGWWCYVSNIGTGLITIDPNSTETINVNGEALSTWVQWTNEIGILQCDGTGFSYYQIHKGTITQTVSSAVASIVFSGCLAYRRNIVLFWDSGTLSVDDQVKFLLNTSSTPNQSGGYVGTASAIAALTQATDNFTLGAQHSVNYTGAGNGMNGQAIITLSDNTVQANITSRHNTPGGQVVRGQTLSLFSSVTRTSITNITIKPNSANFTGGTFTLTEL